MKDLEDAYNERFSDRELPSDGFDAKGLWEDIAADLDADERGASGASLIWRYAWGLLLLLVMGTTVFYLWPDGATQGMTTKESQTEVPDRNLTDEITATRKTPTTSEETTDADTTATYNTTQRLPTVPQNSAASNTAFADSHALGEIESNSFNSNRTKIQPSKRNATRITAPDNAPTRAAGSTTLADNTPTPNSLNTDNRTALDAKSPIVSLTTTSIDAAPTPNNKTPLNRDLISAGDSPATLTDDLAESDDPLSVLLTDRIEKLLLTPDQPLLDPPLPNISEEASDTRVPGRVFVPSLTVYAGSNWGIPSFSSSETPALATLKGETESAMSGYSMGVMGTLTYRNKWTLSSGVEYHRFNTRFEYTSVRDSQILKPQTTIAVVVDANGNVVSTQTGDVLVGANVVRQVRHHNQYHLVSVPIELGYTTRRGAWSYGLASGAVLNFRLRQSGRTLDPSQAIIDFSSDTPATLYGKFGVGIRVSPLLSYHLTDRVALSLCPQWQWSSYRLFGDSGLRGGIHQVHFNLGVGWRF